MNELIKKIIYYIYDVRNIQLKYKKEIIHFLEFCLKHRKKESEVLLNNIIMRTEKGHLLLLKGLLLEFNKFIPSLMYDYILLFNNSDLIKKYRGQLK